MTTSSNRGPVLLRDRQLAELYRRTPGGAVSFVDESYRSWSGPRERPFYSMSAVTFAVERLPEIREGLVEIAGGRWWHTTEVFEQGERTAIARMGRYIARRSEWNVVTVEMPISQHTGGLAAARGTCLAALVREVTRGSGPEAVRLVVADRNRDEHLNKADQLVLTHLRQAGHVDRSVALYHGRMGQEPVLWSADTISWSAYRNLAVDDDRWIAPVLDVLTVLDARTGKRLDMKQPQAAAATGAVAPSPGARRPVAGNRGEVNVASDPSILAPTDSGGVPARFRRGTTVLDDLARQVTQHRSASDPRDANAPASLAARVAAIRAANEASAPGGTDTQRGSARRPQL